MARLPALRENPFGVDDDIDQPPAPTESEELQTRLHELEFLRRASTAHVAKTVAAKIKDKAKAGRQYSALFDKLAKEGIVTKGSKKDG
jgi:hypothetical protein